MGSFGENENKLSLLGNDPAFCGVKAELSFSPHFPL
jgi:hypothetical protein